MNWARFTINGTASTTRGIDLTHGAAVSFALESAPGVVVHKTDFWVYSASDEAAPLASKDAPLLVLSGLTEGQRVQASTPAHSVTTVLPGSGAHSWIVRCLVNNGVNIDGSTNPDYVFERMVCIRTAGGRRKIVGAEGTQYTVRGWADAQNDDVEAEAFAGVDAQSIWGTPIDEDTPDYLVEDDVLAWDAAAGEWQPRPRGGGATTLESCAWVEIPVGHYGTTSGGPETIALTADHTNVFTPGSPVRILDLQGVEYGDDDGLFSAYVNLTGVTLDLLDKDGALFFLWVSEGGGNWHVNAYNDASLHAVYLVGHTASFTTTGAKTVTADNASGLGGTVTVAAIPISGVPGVITVEFLTWHIVRTCTWDSDTGLGSMELYGAQISEDTGAIQGLWWSSSARVVHTHDCLRGNLIENVAALLLDTQNKESRTWGHGPARLVHFHIKPWWKHADITNVWINLVFDTTVAGKVSTDGACASGGFPEGQGLLLATTASHTFIDLHPSRLKIDLHDEIEWTKNADGNFGAYANDITAEAIWVLQ
jgi:hypothetical protein